MESEKKQRVHIQNRSGTVVYSAGFWPGWSEVIMLSIVSLVVSGIAGFLAWAFHTFQTAFHDSPIEPAWLNRILSFIFLGAFDISLIAGIGFLCLWMPYFLLYQLSPKKFWIENNTLYHAAYLLGFIPNKRKIPFKQILNVEAGESNGRYAVSVLYERTLPKWLFVIVVYWNEKLTQWPLTLINGIPTMEEAETIQTALLEPMTTSPVCRVGSKQQ